MTFDYGTLRWDREPTWNERIHLEVGDKLALKLRLQWLGFAKKRTTKRGKEFSYRNVAVLLSSSSSQDGREWIQGEPFTEHDLDLTRLLLWPIFNRHGLEIVGLKLDSHEWRSGFEEVRLTVTCR